MIEPLRIDWLREWDRHLGADRQQTYVEAELERLRDAGAPLLYAALSTGLADQRDVAVRVLGEMHYRPALRLVEGARPPTLDPQGRPLPAEKAGRVLVAKTGVRGQMARDAIAAANGSGETSRYAGPRRGALARTAQGLYVTVEIGREPVTVSLEDAIVILVQWGHGVPDKRYRRKGAVDQWLVVEDCPMTRPLTTPAPKTKAA